MKSKIFSAFVLGAILVAATGCSDKKAEIPKDLNKTLPPPPSTGGSPPVKKGGEPQNPMNKAD